LTLIRTQSRRHVDRVRKLEFLEGVPADAERARPRLYGDVDEVFPLDRSDHGW